MLSLILAFAGQAILVTWFMSALTSNVERIDLEQKKRAIPVYGTRERIAAAEGRLLWLVEHVKDMEQRLRRLENRRP